MHKSTVPVNLILRKPRMPNWHSWKEVYQYCLLQSNLISIINRKGGRFLISTIITTTLDMWRTTVGGQPVDDRLALTDDTRWSQPETALQVKTDVLWVAHRITGSHNSTSPERVPGAATPYSDYHPLCCHLNVWEMTDVVMYFHILNFCACLITSSARYHINWIPHRQVWDVWIVSVAHRSMVREEIGLDAETLTTSSSNFGFSKYCCLLDSWDILLHESSDESETEDKHW